MNSAQRRTLEAIFTSPINGNIEWRRIESLLKALGCEVIEGAGSSVAFVRGDHRMDFHRPHPGKEALRYHVKLAREFLTTIGITP
jgi:hypothetical protein